MRFSHPQADVYVPRRGLTAEDALSQVTHLCVGAHQDDVEIMAHAGIVECYDSTTEHFGSVVVTNGAGSPRTGSYAHLTDEEMQEVRRTEQRNAAELGKYSIQIQLSHPSSAVKQPGNADVVRDLASLFRQARAHTIYIHNPADKHDTHVAVLARALEALKMLPRECHPKQLLGCEVWRDLDWMVDTDKVALNSGSMSELGLDLLRTFASQVAGGKRYDVATAGRRAANATFHTSHATDKMEGITWAMDLTPLLSAGAPSLEEFTLAHVRRLQEDIASRIRRFT